MEEKDTKKNTNQGKGKGKNKKQVINLNDFVQQTGQPAGFAVVPAMRWSDVMDNEDENPDDYGKNQSDVVILPLAPKSARGPDIDISKVPQQPPFLCYLSNLPFEATEDDIHKFFRDLKIARIDLAKDTSANNRARGQGVCEFQDRQSLIDAFTFNKDTIRNRPINLSIHSFEQERENRYRERDNDKEDRTAGDWRSGPEKPSINSNSNFRSNNRSYQDNSPSNNFSNYRNNYRDRNQNYGGGESYDNNQKNNYNNRQYNNRNYNNNYNNNQSNDYQSQQNQFADQQPPRGEPDMQRDYQSKNTESEAPRERPKLVLMKPTKPRPEMTQDQPAPQPISQPIHHLPPPQHMQQRSESESSETTRKSLEPERPVERKKLILAPRKKEIVNETPEVIASKSIFGDARPVDTTKRLQEIELKKKQEEALIEEQLKLKEQEEQEKKELNTSGNREFNKRLSDSGSHSSSQQNLDMGNNRSNYRDHQQHSHDSSSRDHQRGGQHRGGGQNRYRDNDDGYRKPGGNRRNLNSDGRNYDNKNSYQQNSNYNRENQRDNYNRNKYNNNQQNNNWNSNDNQMNRKPDYEDRSPNNRYGGGANRMQQNRNEGSYQNRNRFDCLNEEMD